MKKKILAAVLACAFLLSAVACDRSKEIDRDEIFSTIDDITYSLAKCDMEGIEEDCKGKANTLREAMPVIEEKEDDESSKKKKENKNDKKKKVENLIAGTITSEIDEDSFEADRSGKKCSVDVVFEYKDYQKIFKTRDQFLSVNEFEAYLKGISDKVEVELTLEFEKKGDVFLLTNANDLAEVYDYEQTELNYIDDFFDMVEEVYMVGDNWDPETDSYTDTTSFEMVFKISEMGQNYDWPYRYKVACETEPKWQTLLMSETITEENPEEIHFTYSQDEILPDGLYCILVYSDYTESVMGYEFHVHTTGGS